jgi:hypothetical protein
MTLRRAGAEAPLVQIHLRLIDLAERPTIAASEWEEQDRLGLCAVDRNPVLLFCRTWAHSV